MELSFENMNLDEALGADFDEPGAPETTPEPTIQDETEADPAAGDVETPSPQAEPKPEAEQDKPKNWNPEGPGKPSVALRQAREELRAAREEAQRYQQQVAAFEAQQAEVRRQQEAAAFAAQLETLAIEDPEQAAALIQHRQQTEAQRVRQEAETRLTQERAALSVEYARETFGDFEEVVGSLMNSPQAQFVNWEAIDKSPNPGKALYEYAKSVRPVDVESLKKDLKASLLAEMKQQLTPAKPQAPNLLGNLPAAAPNEGGLDMDQLTKRDFQKHGLNLLDHL